MQLRRIELGRASESDIARMMKGERFPRIDRVQVGDGPVEGVALRGMLQSVLRRADGTVLYQADTNLITNAGWDLLCDVLGKNAQPSDLTHIAIGTGSTAAAANQTTLVTQVARVVAAYAHTAGEKTFTMQATFPAGTGTGALREAGCFNAANAGTMFNRLVFAAVNKGASDALQQTFTFEFAAA